ncbi:SICAvar, type I [Plasmodium knowlesi strain H]|uniref:SICAvar, type I n=2 Tax=Plasmodium knowlesi (strain H) TaxID=5851 RepID=A0A5E7X4R9_PLAKH|nr:SICAvar, type I [Plasmodium knowlesi strain H]CAA9990238.1 SICAvar, type I [Plasmodium knowlesi strain H]SBO26819.1 SICAvar, type I [Plasmodium knowlesi strain H]SBO28439.1 SICAvar, type I [Plasmodium knowlesi strain H]VVS79712.1 SICAvar, type I [Plasmodium knowlesi strain H]
MPEPNAGTSPSGGAAGSGGGLFGEWMKTVLNNGATPPSTPKKITDKLKSNLATTFGELRRWITVKVESDEIKELCGGVGDLVSWGGWGRNPYMQNLCKAVVEIRYFISNVETTGSRFMGQADERARIAPLTPDEAYRRCIVGAVALSAMYGDHCQLTEIIEKITKDVDSKLGKHLSSKDRANLDECKNISAAELMIGRALLHNTIKTWTEEERMKGGGGTWKVKMPWRYWADVCKQKREDANLQQQRKDNAEVMTNFLKLDNRKTAGSSGGTTLAEVLTNENLQLDSATIEKALQVAVGGNGQVDLTEIDKVVRELNKVSGEKIAQECMKNSSKKFCERLDCAKDYWNLTKEKSSSNTGDFWDSNVKEKLNSLLSTTTINADGTTANLCENGDLDSANKAACKHMAKFLHEMYKNGSSDPKQYSAQMVQCLLLKAYAAKLKEQAKQKGYCDIQLGIDRAFESASAIKTTNCTNNKSCIVCNWTDEDYSKLNTCNIDNTSGSVKSKVESMLKENGQTQDNKIQQTLTDINNKNPLCQRLQCLATKGQNNNDKFWQNGGEVGTLWNELSTAMMRQNGRNGQKECNELRTHSEKAACNYLHAGLEALYKGTTTPAASLPSPSGDGNNILKTNPSFRQTMGCFLLHAYANEMKKKSICNIDKGIEKAFDLGKGLSSNGTCNATGKGQCVPCELKEKDYDECKINTDGKTGTPQTEVKTKLKTIITENDPEIEKMAIEVNKIDDLCRRFQCISERWLKDVKNKGQNGDPLKATDWNDVWKEVKKEIPKLRTALGSATTTTNGGLGEYCKGLDEKGGKDACILIAAGLKNLYNTPGDDVNASFQRTMQCVLLNAIADKMREELPCKEERSATEGINEAFKASATIKGNSTGCNDANKCFTCPRFTEYRNCKIKEYSNTEQVTMLKDKVDDVLKNGAKEEMKKIKEVALKEICKPCTEKTFCESLTCVAEKWEKRNKGTSNGNVTWVRNVLSWLCSWSWFSVLC